MSGERCRKEEDDAGAAAAAVAEGRTMAATGEIMRSELVPDGQAQPAAPPSLKPNRCEKGTPVDAFAGEETSGRREKQRRTHSQGVTAK